MDTIIMHLEFCWNFWSEFLNVCVYLKISSTERIFKNSWLQIILWEQINKIDRISYIRHFVYYGHNNGKYRRKLKVKIWSEKDNFQAAIKTDSRCHCCFSIILSIILGGGEERGQGCSENSNRLNKLTNVKLLFWILYLLRYDCKSCICNL